jgi:hypothetical protein
MPDNQQKPYSREQHKRGIWIDETEKPNLLRNKSPVTMTFYNKAVVGRLNSECIASDVIGNSHEHEPVDERKKRQGKKNRRFSEQAFHWLWFDRFRNILHDESDRFSTDFLFPCRCFGLRQFL